MSNINIRRAVENIRSNTTVYTPVVEMIVNAIQAIDEAGEKNGKVSIRNLFFRFGQTQIETEAAEIAKKSVGADINLRKERKREVVQSYVDDKAPWHKKNVHILDLDRMPCNPTDEEIETELQKVKFAQEIRIKTDVAKLLADANFNDMFESVQELSIGFPIPARTT